jgi:hypothetical protein
MKQLDIRTFVGLGLGHIRYADDWAGEFVDVTELIITPYVGYYLTPQKTNIFNPLIRLSLSSGHVKKTCEALQLNDTGDAFNIALALINVVQVNEEEGFGFSFGLEALRKGRHSFNDDGVLYVDKYEFIYYPTLTIDQLLLKKYFGALGSLDKTSLKERKKNDLVNFSVWYVISNLGAYWFDDRFNLELLMPAIGPFLLLSDEYEDFGYENILLLSGVNQTYFLFDYIRTSRKLKGINNNISYKININPIAPSVRFTYNFD